MSLQDGVTLYGQQKGAVLYANWLQARYNNFRYEWFKEGPDPDEWFEYPSDIRMIGALALRDEISRCARLLRENANRIDELERRKRDWALRNDPGERQIDQLMREEPELVEDVCNEYFQSLIMGE
jgi:hypothetical protein